jgi:hypothetical protein
VTLLNFVREELPEVAGRGKVGETEPDMKDLAQKGRTHTMKNERMAIRDISLLHL